MTNPSASPLTARGFEGWPPPAGPRPRMQPERMFGGETGARRGGPPLAGGPARLQSLVRAGSATPPVDALIITSDALYAKLYREILALRGLHALAVPDSAVADGVLGETAPVLIVADLTRWNAQSLARLGALRERPVLRTTPLLALVDRDNRPRRPDAAQPAFDGVLPVPTPIAGFLDTVDRLLPAKRG